MSFHCQKCIPETLVAQGWKVATNLVYSRFADHHVPFFHSPVLLLVFQSSHTASSAFRSSCRDAQPGLVAQAYSALSVIERTYTAIFQAEMVSEC